MPGTCLPFRTVAWMERSEIREQNSLPETIHFIEYPAPLKPIDSHANIAMETRMRPVANSPDQPMFHRIPMHVINMFRVIGLITDRVLPKASLPNCPFALWGSKPKTAEFLAILKNQ